MHFSSLLFGSIVLAIAIAFDWHRRSVEVSICRRSTNQPPLPQTELDQRYYALRRLGRIWTSALFGVIGVLAILAGLVGAGVLWLILWAMIPVVLAAIVVLALLDAWRTQSYLLKKLPELQAASLGPEPANRS